MELYREILYCNYFAEGRKREGRRTKGRSTKRRLKFNTQTYILDDGQIYSRR